MLGGDRSGKEEEEKRGGGTGTRSGGGLNLILVKLLPNFVRSIFDCAHRKSRGSRTLY